MEARRQTHQNYLDYRDRHTYFGGATRLLTLTEFAALEAEHATLLHADRGDEDEARLDTLVAILLLD